MCVLIISAVQLSAAAAAAATRLAACGVCLYTSDSLHAHPRRAGTFNYIAHWIDFRCSRSRACSGRVGLDKGLFDAGRLQCCVFSDDDYQCCSLTLGVNCTALP